MDLLYSLNGVTLQFSDEQLNFVDVLLWNISLQSTECHLFGSDRWSVPAIGL